MSIKKRFSLSNSAVKQDGDVRRGLQSNPNKVSVAALHIGE